MPSNTKPWSLQTPTRLADNAMLGGVCAGLAAQFSLNTTGMRLATLIAAWCLPGVTLVSYALAWLLMRESR